MDRRRRPVPDHRCDARRAEAAVGVCAGTRGMHFLIAHETQDGSVVPERLGRRGAMPSGGRPRQAGLWERHAHVHVYVPAPPHAPRALRQIGMPPVLHEWSVEILPAPTRSSRHQHSAPDRAYAALAARQAATPASRPLDRRPVSGILSCRSHRSGARHQTPACAPDPDSRRHDGRPRTARGACVFFGRADLGALGPCQATDSSESRARAVR